MQIGHFTQEVLFFLLLGDRILLAQSGLRLAILQLQAHTSDAWPKDPGF